MVIVDDQPVIVAGLQLMLNAQPSLSVIGTASDGAAAVRMASELRPDVVLMDIRMPGISGIEAARRIVTAQTARAVLMITTFDDEEYLRESIHAGASGFLLKNAGPDLLSTAVHSAARGDALIDPAMTRTLLERSIAHTRAAEIDPHFVERLKTLSEREHEVLGAIAQGLSNAEIARTLFITEATVKTHLASVFAKTNSHNRVQAALFSYESGFTRPHWAASNNPRPT